MEKHGPTLSRAVVAAALVVLATTGISFAAPSSSSTPAVRQQGAPLIQLAQSNRELQPRYEPEQPRRSHNSYNDEYIFGITRGVADSTMHPAAKIFIFPLTVPFDIVFFPFEVMAGFF